MSWSGVRRMLVAGAVAVLLGTTTAVGPASAHSSLARSDPPDGGVVAVGRTELSLWFDEPIDLATGRFVLRTSDGAPLRVTAVPASGGSTFVELTTAPLRRGVLVLSWTVTSVVDGHVSTGSTTFGAGVRPDPVASGPSGPSAPEVAVRWLQLWAMVVAVGALVAPGLLRGAAGFVPEAPQQAVRLGAVAALVCLMTSLATPAGVLDGLRSDRWAQLWVLRGLALLVATVALAGLGRSGPSTRGRVTAGCALVVAAAADAAAGHAAGLPRASSAAVVATTVHVLATGVWIGTLLLLGACLLPTMRRQPLSRRPLLESTWRSFGPVAGVAAAFVVASGLYLAGRHLPDLSALTSGWYGVALAGKTLLLAVALGTALVTLSIVRPQLRLGRRPSDPARVPRLVVAELAVLAGAIALAAIMTTVPTPRPATAGDPAPGASAGTTVDGLFVTFAAVPAGPGESRLVVRANAVTRPQPGPVTGVDVLLVDGGGHQVPVRLERIEAGHFEGATTTPASGEWQAWVSVHRSRASDAVARVPWESVSATAPGPTRLEIITTVLSALLALAAIAGAGLALRRRRATGTSSVPARPPVPVGGPRSGP